MIQFILDDGEGDCWRCELGDDMKLDEIIICIEKQLYPDVGDVE